MTAPEPPLAAAALTLVGARFRLHGRDPATGLDCVGLVAEALRRSGHRAVAPRGYALRAASVDALLPFVTANRLVPAMPGEGVIVLAWVNPVQPHLLVRAGEGFVHAHAGLGRVVLLPGALPWPVAREWHAPEREA